MFKLSKIFIICFFLTNTSCQFNLKLTDKNNNFKPEKVGIKNFYMHNLTGTDPDSFEVYIDNKKINLETLDISGIDLTPGKHSVDVLNKKTKDPADHFEFEIKETDPKHFYLCNDPKKPKDYSLMNKIDSNCVEKKPIQLKSKD